jgi:hypothetical protein
VRALPTSDADWVSERLRDQQARREAMERHPSWPTTGQLIAQAQQAGVEALLANADYTVQLDPFLDAASEIYAELLDTLVSKQADYGPRAVNQAPGGATLGVLVRAHDKLERLVNLTSTDGVVNHESIRDSWLDLANYAVIGLMVHEGSWPQ